MVFLRKKLRHFIFLCLSMVFLSSCSSDGFDDDALPSMTDIFDIFYDDEAFAVPETDSAEQDFKPVPIDKVLDKPKTPTQAPKVVIKEPVADKPVQKADPNCNQRLFLHQRTISNLYRIYLKDNKLCTVIDDTKVAQHFIMVLIKGYSNQDIRILNADKEFLGLYTNAIKNAGIADRVSLNREILNYGCHLLNQEACIAIKKSLY